jgi:hypothetical protein
MSEGWPEGLTPTAADLRQYTGNVIHEHLFHYTDELIAKAERLTMRHRHLGEFVVAVGGVALFEHEAHGVVAKRAIAEHSGLEVVSHAYPDLPHWSPRQWQHAQDEIWHTVRYVEGSAMPKDRTVFGYIELLEAMRRGTALLSPNKLTRVG